MKNRPCRGRVPHTRSNSGRGRQVARDAVLLSPWRPGIPRLWPSPRIRGQGDTASIHIEICQLEGAGGQRVITIEPLAGVYSVRGFGQYRPDGLKVRSANTAFRSPPRWPENGVGIGIRCGLLPSKEGEVPHLRTRVSGLASPPARDLGLDQFPAGVMAVISFLSSLPYWLS